jgi:hypothetical protein
MMIGKSLWRQRKPATLKWAQDRRLIAAVKLGKITFLQRMLSHTTNGNRINIMTSDRTLLALTAAADAPGRIEVLLSIAGIDGMMPNGDRNAPFVIACRRSPSAA